MKNIIKNTLYVLGFTVANISFASANQLPDNDFVSESFYESTSVIHNKLSGMDKYELIVSFQSDYHQGLLIDDNIRYRLKNGYEIKFPNSNYQLPNESERKNAIRLLNDIKSNFGIYIHIESTFNGYHIVSAYVDNSAYDNFDDVKSALLLSGYINGVDSNERLLKKPEMREREVVGASESFGTLGDVGTQSYISTNLFNDEYYARQAQFARQSQEYAGAASIERAIRYLKEKGLYSGKVNIAVVDSGSDAHPDIEYAWSYDYRYRHLFAQEGYSDVPRDYIWVNTEEDGGRPAFESCLGKDISFSTEAPDGDNWKRYDLDGGSFRGSHGLMVASSITAKNNNSEFIAAPLDSDLVNLISILAVDSCGGGSNEQAARAVLLAMGELETPYITKETNPYPADVVNMSFGGYGSSFGCSSGDGLNSVFSNIVNIARKKNVILVAAAGNDYGSARRSTPSQCTDVIAVGSITEFGDISNFSNVGEVDIMALGTRNFVLSARWDKDDSSDFGWVRSNGLSVANGTSFATPIISSLAGLMKLINPSLTTAEFRNIIQGTALSLDYSGGACEQFGCGAGAVNFERALKYMVDGFIFEEPVVKHFLANNPYREDDSFISEMTLMVPNLCDVYTLDGNYLNDGYSELDYSVFASNDGKVFEEIARGDHLDLMFSGSYNYYSVQTCSQSGCTEQVPIQIDNSDTPSYCNSI